jgi:hypothetical protein
VQGRSWPWCRTPVGSRSRFPCKKTARSAERSGRGKSLNATSNLAERAASCLFKQLTPLARCAVLRWSGGRNSGVLNSAQPSNGDLGGVHLCLIDMTAFGASHGGRGRMDAFLQWLTQCSVLSLEIAMCECDRGSRNPNNQFC